MEPNWSITQVGDGVSPLIIHVPHAATGIPAYVRRGLGVDDPTVTDILANMTDWYTDRLALDALALSGVPASVFTNGLSRLVVDPERFTGDDEPMQAVGMGPVYHASYDGRPLRPDDPEGDRHLLERYFRPYSAAFADLVDRTLVAVGRAVIVDLHSFPSRPLPYEADQSAPRPGVCVGTDPFHTSVGLRAAAAGRFAALGHGVDEDTPFAGTYVPLHHLHRTGAVTSVMIEVRRDLYQEEPGGPIHDGYRRVVQALGHFLVEAIVADFPGN